MKLDITFLISYFHMMVFHLFNINICRAWTSESVLIWSIGVYVRTVERGTKRPVIEHVSRWDQITLLHTSTSSLTLVGPLPRNCTRTLPCLTRPTLIRSEYGNKMTGGYALPYKPSRNSLWVRIKVGKFVYDNRLMTYSRVATRCIALLPRKRVTTWDNSRGYQYY